MTKDEINKITPKYITEAQIKNKQTSQDKTPTQEKKPLKSSVKRKIRQKKEKREIDYSSERDVIIINADPRKWYADLYGAVVHVVSCSDGCVAVVDDTPEIYEGYVDGFLWLISECDFQEI